MNLLPRVQFPTLLGTLFVLLFLSSCEEDLTTIGQDVIGGDPFSTGVETYDVIASNTKVDAVQTNQLAVYQLGKFNDPVYGKTEAKITTQLLLSSVNPSFGTYSQETEDGADIDDNDNTIEENETVKKVYLYIPYLTNSLEVDSDGDGVTDAFDDDDENDNDNDGDNVSNFTETSSGTNPLDISSVDANLDGVNDPDGIEIIQNNFASRIEIDSIYGNRETPFTLKVERSTFFLRDFDPATNFTEAEKYYSTNDYTAFTLGQLSIDTPLVTNDFEILLDQEDDEDTEDVDESLVKLKLNPGIRIPLDADFFQTNILNKEGSVELLNQANFKEYIRGLHLSIDASEDIMFLLDLSSAVVTMTYDYDVYDSESTTGEPSIESGEFTFSLGSFLNGNAVNTFINENYPVEITNAIASSQDAEKIYLKGGSGAFASINLFGNDATAKIAEIRANNWIINEANLVFYVDEVAQSAQDLANSLHAEDYSNVKPPRLYLFNTETNEGVYNANTEYSTDANSPFGVFLNYDGFLQESDSGDFYSIRITDHVNDIILRDSANTTLGLTITPNIVITSALNAKVNGEDQELPVAPTLSPLGTVLHANHPTSEDLKLKLELHYTEVN